MEKTKAKIALAEAILQAMLVKGLITREERDKINEYCHAALTGTNC